MTSALKPISRRSSAYVLVALILAACHAAFVPAKYTDNERLFRDSLAQFRKSHWDNAIAGFEKLTIDLPARDTLFVASLWYLAEAHWHKKEYLLAAQSYTRLAESAPNDSLADDALLQAGKSYARMWRKPSLDSQYGETSVNTLRTLLSLYPGSTVIPEANREIERLSDWFAQKEYLNGMHYYRRHAYDAAIIYFKGIVEHYPSVPTARDALLRLAESYTAIKYREDVAETCETLRRTYPGDREVREVCGAVPATSATRAPPAP